MLFRFRLVVVFHAIAKRPVENNCTAECSTLQREPHPQSKNEFKNPLKRRQGGTEKQMRSRAKWHTGSFCSDTYIQMTIYVCTYASSYMYFIRQVLLPRLHATHAVLHRNLRTVPTLPPLRICILTSSKRKEASI